MKKKTNLRGFTLVEIMIVVAIIGVLASIAIPNFVKARLSAQTRACISNIRQIDGAKQQWALENRAAETDTPASDKIQPYLGSGSAGRLPSCPADSKSTFDSSYAINNLQTPPACQIDSTLHRSDR